MEINIKDIFLTGTDEEIIKRLNDINAEMMKIYKSKSDKHVFIDNRVCMEKIENMRLDPSNMFRYKKINKPKCSQVLGIMLLKILQLKGGSEVIIRFDPQEEYVEINSDPDDFIFDIHVKKINHV